MTTSDVRVVTCGGGAPWEAALVHGLQRRELGVQVVRRCVDHGELVGVALRERPRAAIVAAELPWLDRDLVGTLHDAGVTVMAVESVVGLRPLQRIGVHHRLEAGVSAEEVTAILAGLRGSADLGDRLIRTTPTAPGAGRLVVVWGTGGAPGRSTVAWHLAEEHARRGRAVMLVDGDAWGASLAQCTGVAEGPSVTRAVHLAAEGWPEPLTACLHATASGVCVLPGLPRPDLWSEVRERPWRALLDAARALADLVVVDVAAAFEEDEELSFDRPPFRRNLMTRVALEEADDIIAVAAADPIGVRRLIFAHRDLVDAIPAAPSRTRVVLNRVPTDSARSRELVHELDRWAGLRPVALLPVEPALERAVWEGRPLHQVAPRSRWLRALRTLCVPATASRRVR